MAHPMYFMPDMTRGEALEGSVAQPVNKPLFIDSHHNPSWFTTRASSAAGQHHIDAAADALSPSLIWACCRTKDLSRGISLHDELQKTGLAEKNFSDALITMYAKCGELPKARALLDMHSSSSIIPWTALIAGYARQGMGQNALDSFEQMQYEGIAPDVVTYVCTLKACAAIGAIEKGKQIHHEILRQRLLEHNTILGNALVDMYAKCGYLPQAQSVLEKLPSRDVVSWNALMTGFTQIGQSQQALEAFDRMQREGIIPDAVTFVCILKACAWIGAIEMGKHIHNEILRQGLLDHNIVLGNALVDMYSKCGALSEAQNVLEKLPSRNIISWNSLIIGYAQKGQEQQALECFESMQHEGILPDAVTYMCILTACAEVGALDKGKQIHDEILRQGLLQSNIGLGTALVDMYAKCGALSCAQSLFDELPSRNVVSWNALIAGYAQEGQGQHALACFERMQYEGILPDVVTYVCILKGCAKIGNIDKGKEIHDEILRQGLLEHNIVLGDALVDMYVKCGALPLAENVVDKLPSRNIVSLNAMIRGYALEGQGQYALECFERLQNEGILPDLVTYVCILTACAGMGAVDKGKQIHDEILRKGLLEHSVMLGTALVDMYAKCGALLEARSLLGKLSSRNVVSWNALIGGYAQKGQGQQALECFHRMQQEGILPDSVTYVCILRACASIGAVDKGKQVHDEISRQRLLDHSIVLGNALVDMYVKCGALCEARGALEKLPFRDVVSWSALISGYAQEGHGQQALGCFEQMQCDGVLPDVVNFVSILNLCSHLGLIKRGQELFDSMEAVYGLKPNIDCFSCMVDLFGRAGHLAKATKVIQGMPFPANSGIWHSLLGACQSWVDVNMGTWAFEQALELNKCDEAAYLLMENIYSAAGLQEEAKDIEVMRKQNKAWKIPCISLRTDFYTTYEFSVS